MKKGVDKVQNVLHINVVGPLTLIKSIQTIKNMFIGALDTTSLISQNKVVLR